LDRRALREKTLQVLTKFFFEEGERIAGAEGSAEPIRTAEAGCAARAERSAGAERTAGTQRTEEANRTAEAKRIGGAEPTTEAKRIAESYPHQLSGGQRQRVLLAQAIACNPALLIADEPTASLDPSTQQEILALFRTLRQQLRCTMILITHNPALLAGLADRVLVLYAGRVAEIGPTKEILMSPQHPYTRALLKCLPPAVTENLPRRKTKLVVIPGDSPNLAHLAAGCRFEPRCADRMDACTAREPAETTLSEGHAVSCFRYGG
jgi:oligopeptide/dipeptide ABC transporter ATP-binding protein